MGNLILFQMKYLLIAALFGSIKARTCTYTKEVGACASDFDITVVDGIITSLEDAKK